MVIRFHKKRAFLVVTFLYFLFQQALLEYSTGFIYQIYNYSDEAFECVLICLIMFSFLCKRVTITRIERRMFGCFALFALVGLVSNFVHPMQSWFLNLSDLLVCSRFIVFYFAVRILLPSSIDYKKLLESLAKICRVIAIVLTIISLHDLFFNPIFPKREYRYFMYSLQLCFPHPTYMAVACFTCASILMAAMEFDFEKKKRRADFVCIGLLLLLTFLTLRSKAIAASACAIVLYVMIVKNKIRSKTVLLGGGGLLAAIIGWDQLIYYFTTNVDRFIRARLIRDAARLATEYFPFGTGFATFGSSIAANYYSPLYTSLGYGALHGGSRENPRYLCDTFWGTVIAQSGWVGAFAFAFFVVGLILLVLRIKDKKGYLFWAALSILVYELIASTSEPAFFNPPACLLAAVLALIININNMVQDTERTQRGVK